MLAPRISPTPNQPKLIKDKTDLRNFGMILFNSSTLQEIKKNSGPLAGSCEYQVHYHALVVRYTAPDNTIFDVCIPTVFFNYTQAVTGAHIDFELSDVDDMSEKLFPVHNVCANALLTSPLVEGIKALFPEDGTVEIVYTNLNSIHKHPGSSKHQRFSGTDLATNHIAETGIVFPLSSGTRKPNFAGIMAHDASENRVAHFEYRLADGTVNAETGTAITYSKGRCISYVQTPKGKVSAIESLLGLIPKDRSYGTEDNADVYPVVQEITKLWDTSDFNSMTQFIDPNNVAAKHIPVRPGTYGKTTNALTITEALNQRTRDKYLAMCSAIVWIAEDEIERLPYPELQAEVVKNNSIYYGLEESEAIGEVVTMEREELVEEYESTKIFIEQELAEESNNSVLPVSREIVEELLIKRGFSKTVIISASDQQLLVWYKHSTGRADI